MSGELVQAFERMLAEICPPDVVRAVDEGDDGAALWRAIVDSGFLDALTPEEAGGPGLSFPEVGGLAKALGYSAIPLPVAQTVAARALLSGNGIEPPAGPILLVTAIPDGAALVADAVPMGAVAAHALIDVAGEIALADLSDASRTSGGALGRRSADLRWTAMPSGQPLAPIRGGLRPIAAALRAAEIAGACERLLEMTVTFANQRVQFGRPIGRQQAIQHQIAVMAEQAMMARMAAQLGCAGAFPPSIAAAATAKSVASAAAHRVSAIAHAVHGAIGLSAELDVQLYTRRLLEWRIADGSERYWATRLGQDRIDNDLPTLKALRTLGQESVS